MIYLASNLSVSGLEAKLPDTEQVTDLLEKLLAWRAKAAALTATYLMHSGIHAYSPIAHNWAGDDFLKNLTRATGKPEFEAYQRWDEHMIDISDGVMVLMLEGWQESRGVTSEIAYARGKLKPVTFINLPPAVAWELDNDPYGDIQNLLDANRHTQ